MKSLEEEDPPLKKTPLLGENWGCFSGGVLFLQALQLEITHKGNPPRRGVSYDRLCMQQPNILRHTHILFVTHTLSHALCVTYTLSHTTLGKDQTENIRISRSISFPDTSFEWWALCLLTWQLVWNFGNSRDNLLDVYGDCHENLLENLAVVIIWSPISSDRCTLWVGPKILFLCILCWYSLFPRRWDSKCSSKRKSKSSMVKVHISFQMSRLKRDLGWPSRILVCIPMPISSLVFSGTGCNALTPLILSI